MKRSGTAWVGFFLLPVLLLSPVRSDSADVVLTVCAAGCQYTSVQQAVEAASNGAIIEVAAGQSFTENVVIANKQNITIRSSRWRELPASGYRIDPDKHAALLPTIQSSNSAPALDVGTNEQNIAQNGINLAADTITFDYADSLSRFYEGAVVSCSALPPASMPAPLVAGKKYWVRDWQAGTFQGRLSDTPNGPPIDLTTIGSSDSASYYSRPRCAHWNQPKGIRLLGVRFAVSGAIAPRLLVRVGHNVEVDPVRMGPGAEFRHVVITGRQNDSTGPLICLSLFGGRDHVVQDSWIGHCKVQADESKALSVQNVVGALIRNNYLSAASINLLTAGSDAASFDVNKNLVITGNMLEKAGYMMYREGAGAPSGECYYGGGSGAFYRRTDVTPNTCADGACYTCAPNNTWQLDTSAYYRAGHYLNKNLLEFKDCENCSVEGNVLRGSYGGPDSGQGWCYGLSVISSPPAVGGGSPYHRGHHVVFRNNWADYCYSGLHMVHSTYGGSNFDQIPLKDVLVENNLFTNMGWFPAMTQFSDPSTVVRFILKQSSGVHGFRMINNTFRSKAEYYQGIAMFEGNYPDPVMLDYQLDNNIIAYGTYPFLLYSMFNSCHPDGLFRLIPNDNPRFRNNLFYGGASFDSFIGYSTCSPLVQNLAVEQTDAAVGFTGPANHRLAATSHYSALNPAATMTSAGSSADIGADVDVVEQYALAAEQGQPPMPEQLQLTVMPGSNAAEIRFRRPENATCQVRLYSQRARVPANEIADTNSAGRRLDSRASSVIEGSVVHFVAGAEAALVAKRTYWYRIDCGSRWAVGQFQTRAAGAGGSFRPSFQHPSAASVRIEYSAASDFASFAFTSATFTAGKAQVEVQLPSGFHYWRSRILNSSQQTLELSPVRVFLAP